MLFQNYYNLASKDVSAIRTGDPTDGAGVIDHWAVNPRHPNNHGTAEFQV
jgi:hypothetical protein